MQGGPAVQETPSATTSLSWRLSQSADVLHSALLGGEKSSSGSELSLIVEPSADLYIAYLRRQYSPPDVAGATPAVQRVAEALFGSDVRIEQASIPGDQGVEPVLLVRAPANGVDVHRAERDFFLALADHSAKIAPDVTVLLELE